jgi:PAS domain S-box-containing protein
MIKLKGIGNRRVWMQYLIAPIKSYIREIGKQKDKVRLSHHRFEALLRSGNDLICIIGTDGNYQYVSPSAKQVLHFDAEYFLGKTPFEFIHPDDVSRIQNAFEHIISTNERVHVLPFRFRNAYGDYCWLDSFATNMINDPAICGVVINARDISIKIKDDQEKLLITEKLRFSNERYELVAKATNDVIWDWDLESDQLSGDKGLKKFTGPSDDNGTMSTTPWEEFIHPEDKEKVMKSIIEATTNPDQQLWQSEYRLVKADGSLAFITDRGYIVRDSEKKAIRMVGAMHDNTELKEKELRILEQNKQLHEIAQINSHIIRKPVASILGLIELLDKGSIVGQVNQEVLEHLFTSTKELDAVIRQLNERIIY